MQSSQGSALYEKFKYVPNITLHKIILSIGVLGFNVTLISATLPDETEPFTNWISHLLLAKLILLDDGFVVKLSYATLIIEALMSESFEIVCIPLTAS